MALTRKFLSAMGIEADKIDEIITAHVETVDGLKEEIDKYKTSSDELAKVQKKLEKAEAELKESNADDKWKVKYDAVKEDFENFKKDISAKETKANKTDAYKALLKEAGVSDKRISSILKVSDIDEIEFDEEGKVKDSEKYISSIKEEWSDFIETTSTQGAKIPNPPSNNGGNTHKSKEEILAIKDPAERQKAIAENPSAFGI